MKRKALLLALAVAGLGASFGLTDTGRSDTGTSTGTTQATSTTTTTTTTGDCGRFSLGGTITSVGSASLTVDPTQGRRLKATAGPLTIAVTPDTLVFWTGRGTLAGPAVGDTVRAHGKQCGSTLTAWFVQIRPARSNVQHESGEQKQAHDQSKTAEGHGRHHR
jgi:hypothetical protein